MRLDLELVARKLVQSRAKAQELIKNKKVLKNGLVCGKANTNINPEDTLSLTENFKYVSRGGYKLEAALNAFNINPKGLVCVDIGASTGGFTDCLLQCGAKKVYTIDVGTDQLAESIRDNKKVIVAEHTDIRNISLPEKVELAVVDVSFISLTHILKDISNITTDSSTIITLIKPQFEVGREHILKHGIADPDFREESIKKVCDYAHTLGLLHKGAIESPIAGGDGNIEYLAWFEKVDKNAN